MINTQTYNTIIKISGNHLTVKQFNKNFVFGYNTSAGKDTVRGESQKLEENFNRSTARARQNIFDLVNSNLDMHMTYDEKPATTKFVTLTFAENMTDYNEAVTEFTNFNKRLSYYLYKVRKNVLKYVAVPEYQERGAIHFHIIYFNLPYVNFDNFTKIWGNGFIFINKVKDDITNYAKYIVPYISGEDTDGKSKFELYLENDLINKRRYYTSKGLYRPMNYRLNVAPTDIKELFSLLSNYQIGQYDSRGEFLNVYTNTYDITECEQQFPIRLFINDLIFKHLDKFKVPLEYY